MKILFILFFFILTLHARVIVDDYGRVIEVPEKVNRIYAASPPLTMSLLAFDPKLISALNFPFSEAQKKYAGAALNKPVAGGFFGQGQTPNFERIASSKPDLIIMWGRMNGVEKILAKLAMLHIPVLLVRNDTIHDLISQFTLFGKLTHNTKRADELIAYTKETLNLVASLQKELSKTAPVRYYFAEGVDGLSSECNGSFHLEPFLYSGAQNALDCKMGSDYGMEKISFENILLADPDVLVVMEKDFYDSVFTNAKFKTLRAIKKKQVYLVPSIPFNYITRPPSFMRLMGIRWLIHSFYPNILGSSQKAELQRFEKLFFNTKI